MHPPVMSSPPTRDRTDLWAFAGLGLYLLIGVGSLFITAIVADPILDAVGLQVEAGRIGLSVRNALHPAVWGLLVAATSIPIGRRLVAGIHFGRRGWLVLIVGLALASVTWFLLEEFVRASFGYMDPEYVGFSLVAWPALVAVALAGWAALAVPAGTPLLVFVVLAVMTLGLALAPSAIGAADGIDPANLPLATVLAVDVGYAVVVLVMTMRRRGRGATISAADS